MFNQSKGVSATGQSFSTIMEPNKKKGKVSRC